MSFHGTDALWLAILERSDISEDELRAGGFPEHLIATHLAKRSLTPPKKRRHSEGSWVGSSFVKPGAVVIKDGAGNVIATVHPRDGFTSLPMTANAQAMQATPELIDALHEVLNALPTRADMVRAINGKESSDSILARFDVLDAIARFADAALLKAGARR